MATIFLDNGLGLTQLEIEEKIDFSRLADSLFNDSGILTIRQIDEFGNEIGYCRKSALKEITTAVFNENLGYVVAMLTCGSTAIYILNIGGAWVQWQGKIIDRIRSKFSNMTDYRNYHVFYETNELLKFVKNNF